MKKKQAIIHFDNISLGYGSSVILENVSLEIPKGIFLPFIGPNGAGKTTLLRSILGLLRPIKGQIYSPFKFTPAGYVPQQKSIDPLFPLTARQIIAMGFYPKLGCWKRLTKQDKKCIDKSIDELKLKDHSHKNYRDLSGGTKQKVLIARALVSGADVFIMDEPTSELDEASEKEVLNHLHRFVSDQNKTVLIAHHGLQDLSLYAHKLCMVNHGKVNIINTNEVK